jgi:hypothetical protein
MNLSDLKDFLQLCTFMNVGMLALATVIITCFRDKIILIHSNLLKIKAENLTEMYTYYLAFYKVIFIVFNLVPYIALEIMS